MKRARLLIVWGLVAGVCLAAAAAAGMHGHARPQKTGILLVTFGTSYPEAMAAFDTIDAKVRALFPETPVRWAYTSSIIRHKLAGRGLHYDSPEMALAKMMDEEFTHVAVQSLHTIAGEEFHDLRRNAGAFGNMAGGFERILVGTPLLATDKDIQRVRDAVVSIIPSNRKKDEAVVLMGHGTPHPSNAFYAALMFRLQQRDPNIYVGCVEGYPAVEDIKRMLLERNIEKAYLMPLMSVAGDHAQNDLAGDPEDSWKSTLTRAGLSCEVVLKGTAEYDAFTDIWIDHLKVAMAHFK